MSKKVRLPFEPSDHGPGPHFNQTPKQEFVFHALLVTAAVVIILAGIKAASAIIAPMLLALFATIILLVPLRWLELKGCPRLIALVIVLGCVAVVFFGMSRLVVKSVTVLSKDTKKYAHKIEREFQRLEDVLKDWGYKLDTGFGTKQQPPENGDQAVSDGVATHAKNASVAVISEHAGENRQVPLPIEPLPQEPPQIAELSLSSDIDTGNAGEEDENNENTEQANRTILDIAGDMYRALTPTNVEDDHSQDDEEGTYAQHNLAEPSLTELNAQTLAAWFTKTFETTRQMIERSFLVFIIALFMIFEAARFPAKVDRAFGKGPITNEHLHKIATEIRRYLFLKSITSIMSGIAATFVYWYFEVPGFMFWGLVACFLYFIPNLGGIIASIVPGLLIFMTGGLPSVLLYVVCLTAIECTLAYGIDPKILGHGLGISTVVIILSLIIWGWLLGIIGLFLAAPLTIMVKIILQAFDETKWVAVLIGDGSNRS